MLIFLRIMANNYMHNYYICFTHQFNIEYYFFNIYFIYKYTYSFIKFGFLFRFYCIVYFFISIIIIDIFHIQLPNIKEYITTKTTIIIVTNNIACFLLSEIYTLTLYYNVPITGRIIATFSIYVIVIFANFLISFML